MKNIFKARSLASMLFLFVFALLGMQVSAPEAHAQTKSVTGVITDPTGATTLSNIYVYLRNADYTTYQSDYTGTDGVFEFYDLGTGTYTIEMYDYYSSNNTYSPPLPFTVSVTSGELTDLNTVKMEEDNITGKVVNNNGTAVTSHYIYAYSANWERYAYGYTNSNGEYSLYLPEEKTYTLQTYDNSTQNFFAPSNSTFTVGTFEQQVSLGTMTGMTPNVEGKFLAQDRSVIGSSAYPWGYIHNSSWTVYKYFNPSTTDGSFKAYAPAGTYTLELYASNNKANPDPQTITVPETGVLNVGEILQPAPNIRLTLLETNGTTAVSNAYAYLHDSQYSLWKNATSDSTGLMEFSVTRAGTYTVDIYAYHATQSDPAAVTFTISAPTDTVTQNVLLRVPSMHGKVVDQSGNAMQWASVSVYDGRYSYSGSGWASTDSNGEFRIKSLPTGTYTVSIYPPYSSNGTQLIAPDPFTVSLTQGTMNETYYTSPIQLSQPNKTIAGVVQYPDGTKVSGAYVSGYRSDGGSGYFSATTNSAGAFTALIGKGQYKIYTYPSWVNGQTPEWGYFGNSEVVEFTQANTVVESASVTFEVTPYTSRIIGRVVNPDGSNISSGYYASMSVNDGNKFWNWAGVDSSGNFSVKVPKGTFNSSIYYSNTTYAAPDLGTVTLKDNETYDYGEIQLSERKEFITTTVRDTGGKALPDIYVSAWKDASGGGSYDWASSRTDANGQVTLKASKGKWTVQAYSDYWSSGTSVRYVSLDPAQKVSLSAEQTVSIEFEFGAATATLKGTVQDASGNKVDQYGWIEVSAQGSTNSYYSGLGCSLTAGSFDCKVPAGTWVLKPWMWNATDYDIGDNLTVTVTDSETKDNLAFTLVAATGTISGSVLDKDGNAITDTNMSIFAKRNNIYKYDWSNNGSFSFKVSPGTWEMGGWIEWTSDYIMDPSRTTTVEVSDGENQDYGFVLVRKDSTTSGKVTDSAGSAVQNAYVRLDTKLGDETTDSYATYYNKNEFSAFTDQNGDYSINAPEGKYFVTASTSVDRGYMAPEAVQVNVSPTSSATVNFTLPSSNATIAGSVKLNDVNQSAFVYAYSDNGLYSQASSTDGTFTLNAFAPDTWHVGAIYQIDETTFYEAPEVLINATQENTTYQADLILQQHAETLPAAQTVTFESDTAATLSLSNGAQVIIPSGAILSAPDTLITVTATPVAEAARNASDYPISFLYDLSATYAEGSNAGEEISSFVSEVTVRIPFTAAQLDDLDITSDDVVPKYYDDVAGQYRQVQNVIVDEINRTVSFTITHFTLFGLVTGGSADATSTTPAVTLTLPPEGSVLSVPQVRVVGTVSDNLATVNVRLNSGTAVNPNVGSDGAFETTLTGLTLGANTITVNATNSAGTSPTVTRNVSYETSQNQDGSQEDTPEDVATGVAKDIVVTPTLGGPQVRIFDTNGDLKESFFIYSKSLRSGYNVLTADINGDGDHEILVSPKNGATAHVRVFNTDGTLMTTFFAYQQELKAGAVLKLADLTGDGLAELLVIPEGKAGSHLRAYQFNTTTNTFELIAQEFLYGTDFRGTTNITIADVTGDGNKEVIASPITGGTAHVRVYEFANNDFTLLDEFFAYGDTRIGAKIMTGDLDGNGIRDLVIAPQGKDGGSNIRTYKFNTTTEEFELMDYVMAFGDDWRGEMNIRVADIDSNGEVEIITAPHTHGGPQVSIFRYNNLTEQLEVVDRFFVYNTAFHGGVDFVITNLDGDDNSEVVTTPRNGGGSNLRGYEYNPQTDAFELVDWMMTHNEGYRGQLNVSVVDITGDGDSELVVSPKAVGAGGPNTRIIDLVNGEFTVHDWFMAFDPAFRGGVITTSINQQ